MAVYDLEGACLEVCSCGDVCPCSGGGDPSGKSCDGAVAYRIERGRINGVDVSGLTFAEVAHNTGNVRGGTSSVVAYVDEGATPEQEKALVAAFGGSLGGPLADLAKLWDGKPGLHEVMRVPVALDASKEGANLRIGRGIEANVKLVFGKSGKPMTLEDAPVSPVPGSPLHLGRALSYRVDDPAHGFVFDIKDKAAARMGKFRFKA